MCFSVSDKDTGMAFALHKDCTMLGHGIFLWLVISAYQVKITGNSKNYGFSSPTLKQMQFGVLKK